MNDEIPHTAQASNAAQAKSGQQGAATANNLVHSGRTAPRPEVLPLLPMQETVLFPELVMPVVLDRPASIEAAQAAMRAETPVGLLLADTEATEDDRPASALHQVGTAAAILRYVTGDDGRHHLVCQGLSRFRVREFIHDDDGRLSARVTWIDEPEAEGDKHIDARMTNLRNRALEAIGLMEQPSRELAHAIGSITSASLLPDATAGYLGLKANEKQQILEAIDLGPRLERVQSFLDYRLEVMRLSKDINQATQQRMSEHQRRAMLREQMRSIQRELGEDETVAEEVERLREALDQAELPEDAKE